MLKESVPPSATFGGGNRQFEVGLAAAMTEDGCASEEPPAQGRPFGSDRLPKAASESDAEAIVADRQMTGCLNDPERTVTQALQAEQVAEFLDPVLDVGPAVVATPDFEGTGGGQ